jgi:hypothetical protein
MKRKPKICRIRLVSSLILLFAASMAQQVFSLVTPRPHYAMLAPHDSEKWSEISIPSINNAIRIITINLTKGFFSECGLFGQGKNITYRSFPFSENSG